MFKEENKQMRTFCFMCH